MPFGEQRAAAQAAQGRAEGRRQLLALPPNERHKRLLDDYERFYGRGGAAPAAPQMRTDADVLREQHRFIRGEGDDAEGSWEQRLAAKYYARLFKEYALADLSLYKEQRVGLRWRTEREVLDGKGQFVCGAKRCDAADGLVSYEVMFAYQEAGEEKQALVKLRVCDACARKLAFGREKALRRADAPPEREPPREHKRRRREPRVEAGAAGEAPAADEAAAGVGPAADAPLTDAEHWAAPVRAAAEPSREDEYDAYFAGLFA